MENIAFFPSTNAGAHYSIRTNPTEAREQLETQKKKRAECRINSEIKRLHIVALVLC